MFIKWLKNNVEMSEDGIKDIHEILTDGILNGGNYRNVNIRIPGATINHLIILKFMIAEKIFSIP